MADITCVGTMFFTDDTFNYGWTESYYALRADLPTAQADFADLWLLRRPTLSDNCKILAIRTSNVEVTNDSRLTTFSAVFGTATGDLVFSPEACLLVRLESGALHRQSKFLHGVVVDDFHTDGQFDIAGTNGVAWAAFFNALVGDDFLGRFVSNPTPPVQYGYLDIDNVQGMRLASHRVGRPFGVRRGRRSA